MNILTFDIEDWYCHDNYSTDFEWDKHEVRFREPLEKILDLLDERDVKGTFFCLGWLAEKHPLAIKNIADKGHQIACHSYQHELASRFDKKNFYNDTYKAQAILEDLIGKKVTAYRAPAYSITPDNLYAFEVLSELGFTHDCSIFPAARDFGGFKEYGESTPSILSYNGCSIKEFPINTYKILGKHIIFSGGGYFRVLPYNLIQYFANRSEYVMSYFHPSDFDPDQPSMPHLPFMRQLKNRIGLKGAFNMFCKYIENNEFVNIEQADLMTNWKDVKIVEL